MLPSLPAELKKDAWKDHEAKAAAALKGAKTTGIGDALAAKVDEACRSAEAALATALLRLRKSSTIPGAAKAERAYFRPAEARSTS